MITRLYDYARGHLRQAHWLFALLASVFGLFFVFATPPFWGIDETAHFNRVYQISHGDLNLMRTQEQYSGMLPGNLIALTAYVTRDLSNNTNTVTDRKDVDNLPEYRTLLASKFSDVLAPAYGVANYSPLAYVGPITANILASTVNLNIGRTLTLERIFSLITYIAITGAAIYILREHKFKWFIVLVALLPNSLFNGSMVSADTMLLASSYLLLALFVKFLLSHDKEINKKLLIVIGCVAVIIPLVKVNYALLSIGLVMALPLKKVFRKNNLLIKMAASAGIIVITLGWYLISGGIGNPPSNQLPEGVTSSSDQLSFVLHNPVGFASATFRSFQALGDSYIATGSTIVGWNYISVPISLSVIMLVMIFLVLIVGIKEILPYKRAFIIPSLLSLAGVASVFLALYMAHTPTAFPYIRGVQGRYFIPFILPLVGLLAAYSMVEFKKSSEKYIVAGAVCLSVLVLVWTALLYYMYTY